MGRSVKGYLAVIAAVAAMGAMAQAAEPSYEQLQQEVQQLKARLDQVEARAINSADVDATVASVLRDAERRSQLLQVEGFTAGYSGGKFLIQDAQANWVLHPNFQFQFRGVANQTDDGKQPGDRESIDKGFEVRRMKIGFDGNAFTPDLQYYFLWGSSRSSGDVSLEQAWIKYSLNDQFAMRAGQIRNPVFHEQDTSSSKQLAADRSETVDLVTGTGEAFTQAVTLMYAPKDGPISAEFGFGDGYETGNTNFQDGDTGNWGVFGRVNYFVMGNAKQYGDFSARGNKDDLLVIGAGADLTQYDDENSILYTVDAQWENSGGLGLYVAYMGNFLDNNDADDTFHTWGAIAQAGYMVNDSWEIFGRAGYAQFDSDLVSGDDTYCELTTGVNWFIAGGHACKVTIDLTVLPNGAPSNNSGTGVLASDDTEIMLRGQFQLLL